MSKQGDPSEGRQINPKISDGLHDRLEELARIHQSDKYFVLKVALEYGARYFKRAWAEYGEVRHAEYRDFGDEDQSRNDQQANVLPFTQNANEPREAS